MCYCATPKAINDPFLGVGICMLFLSFSCVIYFGSASYYFLLYLASSFSYSQPWTACDNSWNTNLCRTSLGMGLFVF